MTRTKSTYLALLTVLLSPMAANADAITVIDPGSGAFNGTSLTLGWQFTANVDVLLNQFGIYDDTGDGLVGDADIAIWTNDGTLVVSGTVDAGTTNPLDGGFRWASVMNTLLSAGETYVIGSYYTGTYYDFNAGFNPDFTVDPQITFDDSARYVVAGSLMFPSLSGGGDRAYVGPNFRYVAVPEPGALALLGIGLLGMGAARRRKKV